MSTILKALRRLEEDSTPRSDSAEDAGTRTGAGTGADRADLPASQSLAPSAAPPSAPPTRSGSSPARSADALRERILAEETAADAVRSKRVRRASARLPAASVAAPHARSASAASPASGASSASSDSSAGSARGSAPVPGLALFSTRSVLAGLAVLVAGGLFGAFLVLDGGSDPAAGESPPSARATRTAGNVPPVALAEGRRAAGGRPANTTDRAGLEREGATAQPAPPSPRSPALASPTSLTALTDSTDSTTPAAPRARVVPRASVVAVDGPSVEPSARPSVEPVGPSDSGSLARAAVAPTQSSIAARAELASGSGSGDRANVSEPVRPMSARRTTAPVASSRPSRSSGASTSASSGSGSGSRKPSTEAPIELAKSTPRSGAAPIDSASAAGALPSVSSRNSPGASSDSSSGSLAESLPESLPESSPRSVSSNDSRFDLPTPGSIRPGAAASSKDSLEPERTARAERAERTVERIDRRGLPDLTVVRTSWHPTADRRSAKIRLEETNELMTLREGDAVGGLVITEISPSAVLFSAGEVEIRRRVGEAGSGR